MIATLLFSFVVAPPTVHVRVDGEGFLRFARKGEVVYAKEADLTIVQNKLATPAGAWVLPKIEIDSVPTSLEVSLQGNVLATIKGEKLEIGRLVLASFPEDVRPVESDGLFKIFGVPSLGDPGEGLFGVVRTGSAGKAVVTTLTAAQKPAASGYKPDPAFLAKGGVEIVVPESADVSGQSFTLGDVCEVFASEKTRAALEAIPLGATPPIGIERLIDRPTLLAKLKAAGLDANAIKISGPATLRVRQESQSVTQSQFEQAAIEAVVKDFGPCQADGKSGGPPMVLPKGELALSSESVTRTGTSINVVVAASVDGRRINSRTVRLVSASVPTTLKTGEAVVVLIVSNDVKVETSGKVRKIDQATGSVTVELPTGKTVTGHMNAKGQIEVKL